MHTLFQVSLYHWLNTLSASHTTDTNYRLSQDVTSRVTKIIKDLQQQRKSNRTLLPVKLHKMPK